MSKPRPPKPQTPEQLARRVIVEHLKDPWPSRRMAYYVTMLGFIFWSPAARGYKKAEEAESHARSIRKAILALSASRKQRKAK